MPRVSNHRAGQCVLERVPFRGNNTYGRTLGGGSYAAFSYGEHWPLYVWWRGGGQWYANAGWYSRSTSKHASQLRPTSGYIIPLPTTVLIALVDFCDGDIQRQADWSRRVDTYEEAIQRRNRALLLVDQAALAAAAAAVVPSFIAPAPEPEPPKRRRLLPLTG